MLLGRIVSKAEIDLFRASEREGVIDFLENRIILPDEFDNDRGLHNLHWQELAEVQRGSGCNGHILPHNLGEFDGLLNYLLQKLVKRNLMSEGSLYEGDYCLIPLGGITVHLPEDETTPWGRGFVPVTYYPRIKEDAEEYVRSFFSGALYPVYVAQVLSLPNKPWDISREQRK